IPRSRSSSIESSSCSRISRPVTVSVSSRMRSARVDLPWSMWAMIEKLRILLWSIENGGERGAMKSYDTATIAELERPDGWSPIRKRLGIQAFGVNARTAREAGGRVIPEHDEAPSGHEELYVVVSGRATFTVGGEEIDAPGGTLVFVPDP